MRRLQVAVVGKPGKKIYDVRHIPMISRGTVKSLLTWMKSINAFDSPFRRYTFSYSLLLGNCIMTEFRGGGPFFTS